MNASLTALLLWLFTANVAAMVPSKDNYWSRAYVLIALGVPLFIWVFWQNPWWVGALGLMAGASMLRWPVIYLGRWVKRRISG